MFTVERFATPKYLLPFLPPCDVTFDVSVSVCPFPLSIIGYDSEFSTDHTTQFQCANNTSKQPSLQQTPTLLTFNDTFSSRL